MSELWTRRLGHQSGKRVVPAPTAPSGTDAASDSWILRVRNATPAAPWLRRHAEPASPSAQHREGALVYWSTRPGSNRRPPRWQSGYRKRNCCVSRRLPLHRDALSTELQVILPAPSLQPNARVYPVVRAQGTVPPRPSTLASPEPQSAHSPPSADKDGDGDRASFRVKDVPGLL